MKKILIFLFTMQFLALTNNLLSQKLVRAHCIPEVNVVVEYATSTIKAKDFDNGSFSYDTADKRFTFSNVKPEDDPLFNNSENTSVITSFSIPNTQETINVYVWDTENNMDYCRSIIHYISPSNSGTIFGKIDKNENIPIKLISTQEPFFEKNITTDSNGVYSFANIKSGTYNLDPINDKDFSNGVTTLDLVLIQKHLLQIKQFSKLQQYFSADVSNDKRVDVFDILQIRGIIIGTLERFYNNSYRYMNNSAPSNNIREDFEKGIDTYVLVDGDSTRVDFTKIKIGDINSSYNDESKDEESMQEYGITMEELALNDRRFQSNSFTSTERYPNKKIKIHTPNINIEHGEEFCVPIVFKNHENIRALQFAIKWDTTILKYTKRIEAGFNDFHDVNIIKNDEYFVVADDFSNRKLDSIPVKICFEAIGDKGDKTTLKMNSSQGFENAFYNWTRPLRYDFTAGNIIIGSGCIDRKEIELSNQNAEVTVFAKDLFLSAKTGDFLSVNDRDSITFGCDNEGLNIVSLHYEGANDTLDCEIEINVENNIKPVVVCKNRIDITLDENYSYELTPADLDAGSYDICGEELQYTLSIDGSYSESPSILFDCDFESKNIVRLNIANSSGRYDYCNVLVNLHYTPPYYKSISVRLDTANVVIVPGFGAEITADMLLTDPTTCSNYYDIRIYSKIPSNLINTPGDIENPIINPGIYVVGIFDSTRNSAWCRIRAVLPSENITGFILPKVITKQGEEICLNMRVKNFDMIDSFSFPLSWKKDIVSFNRIDFLSEYLIEDIGYKLDTNNSEIQVSWRDKPGHATTLADNTRLFDICFDAIANNGSKSNLSFSSPTDFTLPKSYSQGKEITNYAKDGSIKIEDIDFCSYITVDLGVEFTEIKASDFHSSIPYSSVISVNGEDKIQFSCADIGENIVELTYQKLSGFEGKCLAKVEVEDTVPPTIYMIKDTIVIDNNENIPIEDVLSFEISDNCTYNYNITPEFLNCDYGGNVEIIIEAIDISGNKTVDTSDVFVVCTSKCATTKTASLTTDGNVIINANMFESKGDLSPIILVNGKDKLELNCDDIGEKLVKLTKKHSDGELTDCFALVVVKDKISAVAICKQTLEVKLDQKLSYTLDPLMVDNGSVDNCTNDLEFSIHKLNSTEPGVLFNCESDTSETVVLEVMDKSGNSNICMTIVKVKPFTETLTCNGNIVVKVDSITKIHINPNDILEGDSYCFNNFYIELFNDNQNTEKRDSNYIDIYDFGKTIYAKVIDKISGNSCNSTIKVLKHNTEFNLPHIIISKGDTSCLDLTVRDFNSISSFKFPISWDTDIIQLSKIKNHKILGGINYYLNSDLGELIVQWKDKEEKTKTLPQYSVLFSLCFDAVGDIGSSSDLKFLSKSELINPEVKVFGHKFDAIFNNGSVSIQQSINDCSIDTITFIAEMDKCGKLIIGDSLKDIAVETDTVFINGMKELYLPEGINNILITVKHYDGSVSKCHSVINILDTIPPFAAAEQFKEVYLDSDFKAVLNAYDFDAGSIDNCSAVTFKIFPKELDCNTPNPVDVTLYVTDKSGNTDTAHTTVSIKYPIPPKAMVCKDKVIVGVDGDEEIKITADMILEGKMSCPSLYMINLYDSNNSTSPQNDNLIDNSDIGNIYACKVTHPDNINYCWSEIIVEGANSIDACVTTPAGITVRDVEMQEGITTDESGCVGLDNLVNGTVIKPFKKAKDASGLDILDLVLIQKYLLGITQITSYQRIAADYNNSGSISTTDILGLQKYLLRLVEPKSWYFIDKSYHFANNSVFNYPNSIKYPSESGSYDFVALKRGDVNFDYGKHFTYPTKDMYIEDEILYKNEPLNVSVKNTNSIDKFEALQYTIKYNPDSIEVVSITSDISNISQIKNSEKGILKVIVGLNSFDNLPSDSKLFTIKIIPKENCVLHEVMRLDQKNNFLAFDNHDILYKVESNWKNWITVSSKDIISDNDIQLYPQPAKDFVYVKIKDSTNKDYTIKVMNLVGQELINQKLMNNRIGVSHLQTGLFLICFYDDSGKIAVKKLVINR